MKQMNRFNRKVQKIIEAFLCIASVIMLAVNLALAATLALGSNWYFRAWNLLALLALLEHTAGV